MNVILTENLSSLGEIGEVVKVAPGYARNYLLPKGLAMPATGKNIRELDHKKRVLALKKEKFRQEMLSLAEKLNKVTIVVRRKVAEEDKLYGSVSAVDVWTELKEKGFDLSRKSVQLEQPVKVLGETPIPIRVDSQITAHVKLLVEKEES